ncbi:uncharacterized protein PADG_07291 [Paracoccidioides brasiliensis Pb18]|uniref:Uncharacterized protein n=1 Tax=Paracoccidioides brasiliensis (strain Pb18) TaxID=502780 RepID=C1GJ55_PARBD|nr:uncharacterized protein PADG_07291 [Paracoccidioides brasiliensis Pb18]EEH42471.2 hypothetical protein PADG_07291 [Paracoccidioides brasiliensis Pb18]
MSKVELDLELSKYDAPAGGLWRTRKPVRVLLVELINGMDGKIACEGWSESSASAKTAGLAARGADVVGWPSHRDRPSTLRGNVKRQKLMGQANGGSEGDGDDEMEMETRSN